MSWNKLNGDPNGIRTHVYSVKGCCPSLLDDGAIFYFILYIYYTKFFYKNQLFLMVLDKRLELLHLAVLDPKSSVATNYTNPAYGAEYRIRTYTPYGHSDLNAAWLPITAIPHMVRKVRLELTRSL